LGPSGVGKTSLLRYLAGLIEQTPDYYLKGTLMAGDAKPLQSRLSYMAQSDCLMPWLTVEENILLGAKLRCDYHPSQKKRVHQLLRQLQLSGIASHYPDALSGGMRQRVALARTLFENKPIVLLDEPFAALDAITRHELQAELCLALKHKTVLLITHDPLEAIRIGDFVYVMSGNPAILHEPIELSDPTPRTINHKNYLNLHTILLEALVSAKEGL
jgi:putative hydroxymethylpyrimidine transport system ATP-binding protein